MSSLIGTKRIELATHKTKSKYNNNLTLLL